MVSPSEKKVLMRQEAESKLLAQANSREPEVRLVKIRSGKGEYKNLTEKQQGTLTELSFYNGIQTSKSRKLFDYHWRQCSRVQYPPLATKY